MSSLSPAEIAYEQQHISDNSQPTIIAVITVSVVVGWASVALRFLARWRSASAIGWDDYMIVIGMIVTTGATINAGLMVFWGLGHHLLLVTDPQDFVLSAISTEVLYNCSIPFIKISLLCLYHRLFPSRRLYWTSVAVGSFIICYIIVQAVCIVTQCIPLSSIWTGEKAVCIDFAVVLMICSIFNIITDLIILGLPIPFLWKLKVSKSKRLQLLGTFALGGLVTLITILRTILVAIPSTDDKSWSDVNATIVSIVEINIGVLSACLPTYRPLLRGRVTKPPTGSSSYGSTPGSQSARIIRMASSGPNSGKRQSRSKTRSSINARDRDEWIALTDVEEGRMPSEYTKDAASVNLKGQAEPPSHPPTTGRVTAAQRLRSESPMGIVVTTDVDVENKNSNNNNNTHTRW